MKKILSIFVLIGLVAGLSSGPVNIWAMKKIEGKEIKVGTEGLIPHQLKEKTEGEKIPSTLRGKVVKDIAPEFQFIQPKTREKLKGKFEIKGRVKNADSVEIYYQLSGAILPVYLGKAQSKEKDIWEYSWDTNLSPNGNYELFVKISNKYGEYESSRINIEIENEVPHDQEKENKLKEKISQVRQEVEKQEEEISTAKEEIKKEATEEIKKVAEEAKKAIPEEKKKIIESEVDKSVQEASKVVAEGIEELAKKTEEEKMTEEEITKKEKEKKKIDNKIKSVQKKLETSPVTTSKKIIKEVLKSHQKEKEEINKQLEAAKSKLGKIKKEKEKKINEIIKAIDNVSKPLEAVQVTSTVSETKKMAKRKVGALLEDLEKKVKEKTAEKIEKQTILVKDSDNDGLSDKEEIAIGTNPFNPDSDGDGFLDGDEYVAGFNPLKPGPAGKIVYQSPKKVLPQKTDIYKVERVEVVTLSQGGKGLKFSGKGLPNSFITLFIFSKPIVVVVKTDSSGHWECTLDKPLGDGQHTVYATLTDNQGQIKARSETFVFVKKGENVFRILETPAEAVSPVEKLRGPFTILILSIVILCLTIALIIIDILARKRRNV